MSHIDVRHITGISCKHDEVQQGGVYVAINGQYNNGEDYIPQAIARGASTILLYGSESRMEVRDGITLCYVPNVRKELSNIAAAFYPMQPANIVAVTGTSGKTSIVEYYRQMCQACGYNSASLGSLGVRSAELVAVDTLTSPEPLTLHYLLDRMAQHGVTHLGIEASSHGLHQHRIDSVRLSAAAFTNLAHEHLDYHLTKEEYFKAKERLFSELLPTGSCAVLNADSQYYARLLQTCKNRNLKIISYGRGKADIRLVAMDNNALTLEIFGRQYHAIARLNAEFQAYNIMCALGLVSVGENNISALVGAIPNLVSAPGRLQLAAEYRGAEIYVDYAHKPDSLAKVLKALRLSHKGRLLVVFGCGGDRDTAKRPLMGAIAADGADIIVVTDDNPRTEDAASIRQQILASCPKAVEIGDRTEAIKYAISQLQEDDVLLVAGKGHEDYQIIGHTKHPFSDLAIIQQYTQG